ncbi:MAG: GFA family protein [Alphaproteobacteria bacterium]|nr:GFA family protein [Alphaproteobacteria bacterium]
MTLQSYSGGCHCGKVHFDVTLDAARVISCNCSFCRKLGSLLAFTTPDRFTLAAGADALTEYRFNTRKIRHLFCNTCGVESFARGTGPDGKEMVAVNVRCLDDFDLDAPEIMPFDGKNH